MSKTLREKYVEALKHEGYTSVPSRSRKYVVFKRTENTFFYIELTDDYETSNS